MSTQHYTNTAARRMADSTAGVPTIAPPSVLQDGERSGVMNTKCGKLILETHSRTDVVSFLTVMH